MPVTETLEFLLMVVRLLKSSCECYRFIFLYLNTYFQNNIYTKSDLCNEMQLSGVQCAGNPHFWVNEDGSYQEEGQKNTRGYIWRKVNILQTCLYMMNNNTVFL